MRLTKLRSTREGLIMSERPYRLCIVVLFGLLVACLVLFGFRISGSVDEISKNGRYVGAGNVNGVDRVIDTRTGIVFAGREGMLEDNKVVPFK